MVIYTSVITEELSFEPTYHIMTVPVCALCYTDIERAVEEVTSGAACQHTLHASCVRTRLSLDRLSDAVTAVAASCPVCNPPGLMDTLTSINSRLEKIDSLVNAVKQFDEKVDKLAADNVVFRSELDEVEESVSRVKGDLVKVVKDTDSHAARLQHVEAQLAGGPSTSSGLPGSVQSTLLHLACRDMANQLMIRRVHEITEDPSAATEDLKEFVVRLGLALGVQSLSTDVIRVERLGRKPRGKRRSMAPGQSQPAERTLLVELSSRARCLDLIAAKKAVPNLCASQVAAWYPASKVYINHRYPAQLHQLRDEVLNCFPARLPKSVWIQDEAVLIRVDGSSNCASLFQYPSGRPERASWWWCGLIFGQ